MMPTMPLTQDQVEEIKRTLDELERSKRLADAAPFVSVGRVPGPSCVRVQRASKAAAAYRSLKGDQ